MRFSPLRNLHRRVLATLAAAAMLVTGPAFTTAAGADGVQVVTSAEAEVSVDDDYRFDDAFKIVQFDDEIVNPGNYAYAHAVGCEGCQAVALSFQIVLVQVSPEELAPENLGLALNESCESCVAAAGAYQFVFGGRPVRLTDSGHEQLHGIKAQVHALKHSGLSGPEIVAEADLLADQVRAVLKAELRFTDGEGSGRVAERRVRDKGRDDRSEDSETYAIDG